MIKFSECDVANAAVTLGRVAHRVPPCGQTVEPGMAHGGALGGRYRYGEHAEDTAMDGETRRKF